MDLLGSKASIIVLRRITRMVIEACPEVPELRGLTEADYEPTIRQFLGLIRQSFPHVVVTNENRMMDKNGRISKRDCVGNFVPQVSVVIELNESVSPSRCVPNFTTYVPCVPCCLHSADYYCTSWSAGWSEHKGLW